MSETVRAIRRVRQSVADLLTLLPGDVPAAALPSLAGKLKAAEGVLAECEADARRAAEGEGGPLSPEEAFAALMELAKRAASAGSPFSGPVNGLRAEAAGLLRRIGGA